MDRTLYASLAQRASDLVDAGGFEQAIEVLGQLVESELPDFDKAMMWLNIATVRDKMGDTEGALAAQVQGLECEARTTSYFVVQQHGAYLARLGRYEDAIVVYQGLVERPDVTPEHREMFVANIVTLQGTVAR